VAEIRSILIVITQILSGEDTLLSCKDRFRSEIVYQYVVSRHVIHRKNCRCYP